MMTIVFVSFFSVMAAIAIFGKDNNEESEKEKEKTKQLMIQYKIDSLNYLKKDTIK